MWLYCMEVQPQWSVQTSSCIVLFVGCPNGVQPILAECPHCYDFQSRADKSGIDKTFQREIIAPLQWWPYMSEINWLRVYCRIICCNYLFILSAMLITGYNDTIILNYNVELNTKPISSIIYKVSKACCVLMFSDTGHGRFTPAIFRVRIFFFNNNFIL